MTITTLGIWVGGFPIPCRNTMVTRTRSPSLGNPDIWVPEIMKRDNRLRVRGALGEEDAGEDETVERGRKPEPSR
ncbi:hypothetical protein NDU88_010471 [Pleurodeles waltl]|uniref:Uncharacterized protein n=1 Tax=Pleurodeles waltl TaxID=8319 RepID=A0AAV7S1C4_PLEWA|nr:hypothetical protein NDU88_010471 [Pleurodeles waltl]